MEKPKIERVKIMLKGHPMDGYVVDAHVLQGQSKSPVYLVDDTGEYNRKYNTKLEPFALFHDQVMLMSCIPTPEKLEEVIKLMTTRNRLHDKSCVRVECPSSEVPDKGAVLLGNELCMSFYKPVIYKLIPRDVNIIHCKYVKYDQGDYIDILFTLEAVDVYEKDPIRRKVKIKLKDFAYGAGLTNAEYLLARELLKFNIYLMTEAKLLRVTQRIIQSVSDRLKPLRAYNVVETDVQHFRWRLVKSIETRYRHMIKSYFEYQEPVNTFNFTPHLKDIEDSMSFDGVYAHTGDDL